MRIKGNRVEICYTRSMLCGRVLEYSLSEIKNDESVQNEYYLSAKITYHSSDDEHTSYLGHDRKRALKIFELLSRNAVTPCTMEDVLSDMDSADLAV